MSLTSPVDPRGSTAIRPFRIAIPETEIIQMGARIANGTLARQGDGRR
jgi:hypothetical protein